METKYITYKRSGNNAKGIIFSALETHSDIASDLCLDKSQIVGAGFCSLAKCERTEFGGWGEYSRDMEVKAYGKSVSLGVDSHDDDSGILTELFFNSL